MVKQAHYKQRRSLFFWIVLISIILHILALLLFLSWKYDLHPLQQFTKETPFTSQEQQQEEDRTDLPAELKARDSSFGAPVVFQNMPEQQQQQQIEEQPEPQDEPKQESEEPTQEEQKTEENDDEKKDGSENLKMMSAPAKVKPPVKKKRRRRRKKVAPTQQQLVQQAQDSQKKLTFADLAQGFLDTLNEGGKDWFSRKGDPNKRPDFEEMKYLSYTQKIAWYMQQAWRLNPPVLTQQLPASSTINVIMVLDKEGNLIDLQCTQNTGLAAFDSKVLEGIRAASPYPPLPEHFKREQFTINFGIRVYGQQSSGFRVSSR